MELSYTPSLNTREYTISVWVYPTKESSSHQAIYSSRDSHTIGYNLYINPDDKFRFYAGNGSSSRTVDSSNLVTFNKWTNVIVKYDGTKMFLYENNQQVGTRDTSDLQINTQRPMRIGSGMTENNTPDYYYNGLIQDLRYYDRALSDEETSDIYNNKQIIGDEILHLPFNKKELTYNSGSLEEYTMNNIEEVQLVETMIPPKMKPQESEWQFVTELDTTSPMNNPWTGEGDDNAPKVNVPLSTLSTDRGRDLEIKVEVDHFKDDWRLVTEVGNDVRMNNPWTGKGYAPSPPVYIPLNQISSETGGTDLEIKIEWTNTNSVNNGTISKRFYKGWRLDYVFDYELGDSGATNVPSSDITVYAKWNEEDEWYSTNQRIRKGNDHWNWSFLEDAGSELSYKDTMTGDIGYKNMGFLLHGHSNKNTSGRIYTGQDQFYTQRYDTYRDFTTVRVYVKSTSKIQDLIYSRSLVKPPTTNFPLQGNYYRTATRYYKGWCLDEVFNFRRDSSATKTPGIVYARERETDNWYGYNQSVNAQKNNERSWYFGDGEGEVTKYNREPVGEIGTNNLGFSVGTDQKININDLQYSVFFSRSIQKEQTGNAELTIYNNPTINDDGMDFVTGSSHYASLGATHITGNQVSFAIWFNLHSLNNWQRLFDFSQSQQADDNIYIAFRTSTDELTGGWYNGSTHTSSTRISYNVSLNTWYHAVWTLDRTSNSQSLYINGSLHTTNTPADWAKNLSRVNSYIGRSAWSTDAYLDGQIKSLYVFSRALTANEVSRLYYLRRDYDLYNGLRTVRLGRTLRFKPSQWALVTEVFQNKPLNNPWLGTGETGAPPVFIPLNQLSINSGRDLEIKIEVTTRKDTYPQPFLNGPYEHTNDQRVVTRYYKGWYLNDAFDYTRSAGNWAVKGTEGMVYARFSEDKEWYGYWQSSSYYYNQTGWSFHSVASFGSTQNKGKSQIEQGDELTDSQITNQNYGFTLIPLLQITLLQMVQFTNLNQVGTKPLVIVYTIQSTGILLRFM